MGRTRLVIAVVLLVAAGACTYESSKDDEVVGGDGSRAIDTTSPGARPLRADGDGAAVCAAADAPEVLADEAFDLEGVRWVFCGGTADGGVLSLRSVTPGQWEVRDLPLGSDPGSGDALAVTVADASRAWATLDALESQAHEHLWTTDGGLTWTRLFPGG